MVTVALADAGPLELRPAANAGPTPGYCAALNAKRPLTCAWAAVELSGRGWVPATVAVNGSAVVLRAQGLGLVLGTAYGWGAIPLLSVYDRNTSLPVLPWNRSMAPSSAAPAAVARRVSG